MPVFGFSGAPDASLLTSMQSNLAHRGSSTTVGDVLGGTFTEAGQDNISIAWAGHLRTDRTPLGDRYRKLATNVAADLDGEFVIAVRDGNQLHLVRDHAGARTAYFAQVGNDWFVATEPKGIWKLKEFDRRLRAGALAQYLSYSFIPGENTMLAGLYEVLPGHCVTLESGRDPVWHRYFSIDLVPTEVVPLDECPGRFRSLLEQEVATRLAGVEQPTVFLSGGLDSSIVAAEVARQSSKRVRTFSIHFGTEYPNELEFAQAVADRIGTEHHEVEITPQMAIDRIRQMVWHLDEPIGDPITAPNFELATQVSKLGADFVFNGEGGDPLFGGPKNLPMLMSHWYGGVDHTPGFRERRYVKSYRRAFSELPYVLTPEALAECDYERDLYQPLTPFFESKGPFLHKLLAINTQLKGAHLILPKVERMLAAAGLTPLSPMFTRRMIDLTFGTPPNAKLRAGVEKWMLRQAYADDLPASVIERPKSGMRVPVHFWFKGPLKKFARDALSRKAMTRTGLFRPERVKQWLDYDIEGSNGRYGLRLWMLLTFEIWHRIVIDGEAV